MENENLEECVHQQDSVGLNGGRVQENRFWRSLETVAVEDGLDHDQTLGQILAVQTASIEGGLVRAVVEHLEKLGPSQMEHELRIQGEVLRQSEAVWTVLVVFPELLAKSDQHPVHPPQYVRSFTGVLLSDFNSKIFQWQTFIRLNSI